MTSLPDRLARPLASGNARRQAFLASAGAVVAAVCAIALISGLAARPARNGPRSSTPPPRVFTTFPVPAAGAPASRPRPPEARRQPSEVREPGPGPSRAVAAVRRFADAYMDYQVARLTTQARHTLVRTATPALSRYLLARPAQLGAEQLASPGTVEVFRVASVNDAGPGTFAISYVSAELSSDTGMFLVRVARAGGRWLVSAIEP
jgi:hypothetical protein